MGVKVFCRDGDEEVEDDDVAVRGDSICLIRSHQEPTKQAGNV
jgi:hypothetical protein